MRGNDLEALQRALEQALAEKMGDYKTRGVRCVGIYDEDLAAAEENNWLYDSEPVRRIFKGGHTDEPECPVCDEARARG